MSDTQMSLFGHPVTGERKPPTRPPQARRRFPLTIQCQDCGALFGSFVRLRWCDDCTRERPKRPAEEPRRWSQMTASDRWEDIAPGF